MIRDDDPFCPRGFEYVRYQTEVPSYVLGLMNEESSRDFERRVAAAKGKIAEAARK